MTPLLESDIVECPHKGRVNLVSNVGKYVRINNASVITESDLKHSSITGCTNNIAGIPNPCTSIATIPSSSISSDLVINKEGVILTETISSILTNQGFPLILQNTANATNKVSYK